MTVGAFLDRWLLHLPGHISDGTLDDYEDTVRLRLKPGLGRHKLTKLTVAQVDALWQAKRKAGYRANNVRNMRAVLGRPWARWNDKAWPCGTSRRCRCLRAYP
ncbi:hypothetical protein [Nonomuraea jabiensis]|uniref:hypothetical protein n=1 Tax=Nonomuraea jabiensis TaxID=882448 RepID=UPI003D73B17E